MKKGRSAMPDIVKRSELDSIKKQLEGIANSSAQVVPQLSDAIQAVLTAADYADKALLESSLNALFSCLADVARDIIERELKAWEGTKKGIKESWQQLDGFPCE